MKSEKQIEFKIRRWFVLPQNVKKLIRESDIHQYDLRIDFDRWVYAFYVNNKLMGYAYVENTDLENDKPKHLYIYEFEIKEEYRKNGYGTVFIQQIKKKYPKITVTAVKSSVKFWRKNKFKVWDRPFDVYQMSNY